MKNKYRGIVVAVSLIAMSTTFGVSSAHASSNSQDLNVNQKQTNFFKNGRLMKALDGTEVGKALQQTNMVVSGNLDDHKVNTQKFLFDDGSSVAVSASLTASATPSNVANVVVDPGGGGSGVKRYVTGTTTYTAYSWTGLRMWSYSLNQYAQVDGSHVTWYESIPYTSYDNSLLSYWHVDSEALGVNYLPGGDTSILSTANAKLSFGFKDFVSLQSWNLKGNLTIYCTGSYTSSWTKL